MADWRALTVQAGIVTQIVDADSAIVGAGVKTAAGNLSITPFGTDVSIGAGKNLSTPAGAGNVDFSASTGTFKTSTGAVTVGGAATFSAAGTALTVTNNISIGGTLAATGLSTLTGGAQVGAVGIDATGAIALPIGTSNATSITIGKVGVLTTVAGNLQVSGTETVVGATTFTGAEQFNGLATFAGGIAASGANANDFSGGTGTFKTSTGAVTVGPGAVSVTGATAFVGVAVTASGAASVDLSGGSGVFKTTTGAVTVGPGAVTVSGAATFSAAGTALTVTNNASVGGTLGVTGLTTFSGGVAAAGAGNIDFSGSSGAFLTSTGAVTIGPGAVTVSGVASFTAAGNGLSVTNNAIVSGNLTVGGTLTVTGVATLSAGAVVPMPANNTSGIGGLAVSGLTTAGVLTGFFGYLSAANTISLTDAAAIASARVFGGSQGTAGQMVIAGVIANAKFTTAGGSPAIGAPVFLAVGSVEANAAGKLTATAPSTQGQVVAEVGICIDNASYAIAKTAKILLQVKPTIQL